jgi:hypothetical protein
VPASAGTGTTTINSRGSRGRQGGGPDREAEGREVGRARSIKSPLWAEGIEEIFPELDFRFVAGAGHFIPFEAPEETLAAVRTAIEIIH